MSILPARHSPQTSFYDCLDNRHHKEDISNLTTVNNYTASGHFCVQGDLIVRSQSHEQLAG